MPTYNENLARLIDPSTSKVPFSKLATPLTQSDLTDLSVGSGTTGQTIKWNGSAWTHADVPSVDTASYATEAYINTKVTDLVNGAPAALDTLAEFATALDNNSAIGTQIQTHIANGKMKAFVADGSTDMFAMDHNGGNVDVWLNGVKLNPQLSSNGDQTYADAYIGSNDAEKAFESVNYTPVQIVADLTGANHLNNYNATPRLRVQSFEGMSQATFHFWDDSNAIYNSIPQSNYDAQASAFVSVDGGVNWMGPFIGAGPLRSSADASDRSRIKVDANVNVGMTSNDEGATSWSSMYNTINNSWDDATPANNVARIFYGVHNSYPSGGGTTGVVTVNAPADHVKLSVIPDSGDVVIVRAY